IHSPGHVIVYGDVNPGAKIIAVGDIFIWGRLRGNVHAGAEGNTEAIICALDMNPNQIRIADILSTSPDNNRKRQVSPERAFIQNGQIMVEVWD
ncbi:MAG: septum site-determining protein MinC, partial [Aggregatilineales bacterium]